MRNEKIDFGEFVDILAKNEVFITANTECKMIRVGENKLMIVVTCDKHGHELNAMYCNAGKIKGVGPDMARKLWLACKLRETAIQNELLKRDTFNKRFR